MILKSWHLLIDFSYWKYSVLKEDITKITAMKSTISCLILFTLITSMCTPVEQYDLENGIWIDLTHEFSEETLYWPTSSTFKKDTVFAGITDAGFYYESFEILHS